MVLFFCFRMFQIGVDLIQPRHTCAAHQSFMWNRCEVTTAPASEPLTRSHLSIDPQGPEIRLTPDLTRSLANCMRGGRLWIMWVDSSDLRSHSSSFIHHITCGNLSPGMSENLKLSRPSGFGEWCSMLHKLRDVRFRIAKWWAFWCVRICGHTGLRTQNPQ